MSNAWKDVNSILEDYGLPGGLIFLVGVYYAFFTEQLFRVPYIDNILLEKILVFFFAIIGLGFIYVFKRYRKRPGRY